MAALDADVPAGHRVVRDRAAAECGGSGGPFVGLAGPAARCGCRCAATPVLLVVLMALGLFLPFFGLSVLVVLLLDQLVIRRVPALAELVHTVQR